jgi:hypothetical protein
MASSKRKHRSLALVIVPGLLVAVGVIVPVLALGSGSAGAGRPALPIAPAVKPARSAHAFERVAQAGAYAVRIRVAPNTASSPNAVTVHVTKNGKAVPGARAALSAQMLDMAMPARQLGALGSHGSGHIPVLGMGGHWRLRLDLTVPGRHAHVPVAVVDRFEP